MTLSKNRLEKFSSLDWALAIGVFISSLGLYIRTLAPGILPGDSAEFQVLAYQLGIAHCPGYPIYLLLAKIFTFLPVGEIAYRVNLFSAFMAALAVLGVFLGARLLGLNRWSAVFGALVMAVSYTFWSQAIIAEVYTASAAFSVLIFVCVLAWWRTGKTGILFVASFLGGLSLGVHTTVVAFAPGIILFIGLNRKKHPAVWRSSVGGALVGVLLWFGAFYALDWNSPSANIFNGAYGTARSAWGLSQEDLEDPWTRIWFVASGRQWRSALDFDLQDMAGQAGTYLSGLPREFSYLTLTLILVGLAALTRRDKRVALFIWLSLIGHWLIVLNYRIGDIYVFYINGYLLLALGAAAGLDTAMLPLLKINGKWSRILQVAVSTLVILFGVGSILKPHWPAVKSGEIPFIAKENFILWEDPTPMAKEAFNTVEQIPPNAVVFIDWNRLYVYYYAAHIQQNRTDLRFIEASPRSDTSVLPVSVIAFIDENIDLRPIYFSQPYAEVEAAGFEYRRANIWFSTFYRVIRP